MIKGLIFKWFECLKKSFSSPSDKAKPEFGIFNSLAFLFRVLHQWYISFDLSDEIEEDAYSEGVIFNAHIPW
ncbi:MAG: hypothetical protein HOD92_01175 [Deltaproteobacteria bacterium]|jgi:hypothetical protein|nr:hypothetical protein [Deltaproteobacteria bacterium]MBT4527380.1 hypothetical protein [Deltaproteobacteria bacterium]